MGSIAELLKMSLVYITVHENTYFKKNIFNVFLKIMTMHNKNISLFSQLCFILDRGIILIDPKHCALMLDC